MSHFTAGSLRKPKIASETQGPLVAAPIEYKYQKPVDKWINIVTIAL
jgi:hypothetical protein